ncbi:spindle apparatus coiled-coil protein 1 spindly [Calliopsis andreniformis]|uniref:spindle apparatus coiled-coil protein 1 spindly n=1 Tax=Calliopsis andreniformis TaxID=337506 RepID=UPI003FCD5289
MSVRELDNTENHDEEEYTEEDSGISGRRCCYLLKAEYEQCRQEVHDLKRKLELKEAMLREVQEANEMIERSSNRQILEKERIILEEKEKHRVSAKEYENVISDFESMLTKRSTEIEVLRQRIDEYERNATSTVTVTDRSANVSLEINNLSLRNLVDELETHLLEEKKKSEHAEEMIRELQSRCDEFQHISRDMKERLDQKTRALEDARAELETRAQAISLEMDRAQDLRKGNSLFAEVEDRRRNVVDKMNILRDKYAEVKRVCKAQMAEIKMLKTERATILREWKNYTDHTLATNDELIQKYKNRMFDLEDRLKSEIKRKEDTKQLNSVDASFGYFQSLLDTKKKEVDELRVKIEDLSTQLLLKEEAKLNVSKRLQYWQYKASALEAGMCVLQGKLELVSNRNDDSKGVAPSEDLERFAYVHEDVTNNDKTETVSKQEIENFDPSLLTNSSSKIKTTFRSSKLEDERKVSCRTTSEEKFEDTGRNVKPNESKCSKRVVRFIENLNIGDTNDTQVSTNETYKYPVVYTPVNSNDL